ncbi:MAG: hypothetical protein IJ746_04135 [Ruminococcus sp.]|nr:hypothetical protein [Ruminococcus sp.]
MNRKISWMGYKAKSQTVSECGKICLMAAILIVIGVVMMLDIIELNSDTTVVSVILFIVAALLITVIVLKVRKYLDYIRQLNELPEDEYELLHKSENKSHFGIWFSKHYIVAPEGFLIDKISNVLKFDIIKHHTNGTLDKVYINVRFNNSRNDVRVPVNGSYGAFSDIELPGAELGLVLKKVKEDEYKASQKEAQKAKKK